MLTALAITWFFSEVALTHPFTSYLDFVFLVILAGILDYGIWTLGDS